MRTVKVLIETTVPVGWRGDEVIDEICELLDEKIGDPVPVFIRGRVIEEREVEE